MKLEGPLLPEQKHVRGVSAASTPSETEHGGGSLFTRDHEVVKRWAARRGAEPATGEATSSGPATLRVNDGGAGIRFNFPGTSAYRPISWDEWLANFDRNELAFVYDSETGDGPLSSRYRIVRAADLPAAD